MQNHQQNNQQLVETLQQHMALYGYQPLEIPIIEDADLFLTKAGDQVAERLFTFERYGQKLALRPEFTAAAAHRYISQGHTEVVRWQFTGPIFEDNPQAKSKHYQQLSVGAEMIGVESGAADAEIISMAVQGLLQSPVELGRWQLRIGHVGLTRHLLRRFKLDERTERFILQHRQLLLDGETGRDELLARLDHYFPKENTADGQAEPVDFNSGSEENTQQMLNVLLEASKRGETMGGRDRDDIARRLLTKRAQAAQREQVQEAIGFLQQWTTIRTVPHSAINIMRFHIPQEAQAEALLTDWLQTLELLKAYNIPNTNIIIQPDLTRTWDYYTGIVFEIRSEDGTLLAGGGRYDELAQLLGAPEKVPAVGFMYYLDNLPATQTEAPKRNIMHLTTHPNTTLAAIWWANLLRGEGFQIAIIEDTDQETSLSISDEGRLVFRNHAYSSEQIDLLLIALKEAQDYDRLQF